MLEHVALGQSRFMTPGVAPDPRGVLLGRYGILVFPSLEGVVSWFRVYAAESSLDELVAGLEVMKLRTPLKSRAMAIRIPATSSHVMDRASRCAELVGGTTYTGTGKQFVKYRDDRSPYGYDAAEVTALPPGTHFMCHNETFTQAYTREGEISLSKLLFRLSLRRIPGGDQLRDDQRKDLLVVAERGLGDGLIHYLWRNRVAAEVALSRPQGESAFDAQRRSYLTLRVAEMPQRILDLFIGTPGITVFRMVSGNVAVEVGYSHPIELSSCSSVFEQDRVYVFWGRGRRVDVIAGPLEPSSIEHLTRVDVVVDEPPPAEALEAVQPEEVGVDLQLSPSMSAPRRVVATLVPAERSGWVKQLVFLLPGSSLRGHRVAVTKRGILLVAEPGIDVIPLGQLLSEISDGLLVPLGMELVPRVAPEVLAQSLGHGPGMYTVFPPDGPPFQISEGSLQPLERRSVARIEVDEALVVDTSVVAAGDPKVVNDPVGSFALWGFPAPPSDS